MARHQILLILLIATALLTPAQLAPFEEEDIEGIDEDESVDHELDELEPEYIKYMHQVERLLSDEPEFIKRAESLTEEEIKSGHVAKFLVHVSSEMRSKLDELKRIELERLRKLVHQLDDNVAGHLDHRNPHTFEEADLNALIKKAVSDLDELERKRSRDFKQYEMEKEVSWEESLQNMTTEERAEAEANHTRVKERHAKHDRVHQPGSKAQLEEVWEKPDQMGHQPFNPKAFFLLHDINSDGYWDMDEVAALMALEVGKLYNVSDPSYDRNEANEEYHRMRRSFYRKFDRNKDYLISQQEFFTYALGPDFEKDDGWLGIEEARLYSEEELKRYKEHRKKLAEHYAKYGSYQRASEKPEKLEQ